MPWYPRMQLAIKRVLPLLLPTQATNLALLVSALLAKRTACLSELARAYPRPDPEQRRVRAPKHDLLYRLKRLWRFLDNPRIDAQALQLALIPTTIAGLGYPRLLGLAIDWTFFDSVLPSGRRIRYQVLRIAVPRRGRALPLLQLAYDRDNLPAGQSQNQLEEAALLAVVRALPPTVRPVVLADRGFARAAFLTWLQEQGLDYVVRITAGTGLVAADGSRWRLGTEGVRPGEIRWAPNVRYGQRYQGRPRDLWINVALCWRLPRHVQRALHQTRANEPWYLATNQPSAAQAVAWYRQRFWIEESFKDSKSRFQLKHVRIGSPERLTRLLLALTIALCWLALAALPECGILPAGWHAAVAQWGRASFLSLALALLDALQDLPLPWLVTSQ
jgi:hypothetical protein